MPRGKKTITESEIKEKSEKTVNTSEEANVKEVVLNEPVKQAAPKRQVEDKSTRKTYADTDLIPCRSILSGYLNMYLPKTKSVMEWMGNGDVCMIEYQDLRSAMISRSPHIMKPYIVIEDEGVLELPEWAGVKKVYEEMYTTKDLSEVLDLPLDKMKQVIKTFPVGAKSGLVAIAKERIDNKTFDSMNKIKALDEEFGTDLMLFITDGE